MKCEYIKKCSNNRKREFALRDYPGSHIKRENCMAHYSQSSASIVRRIGSEQSGRGLRGIQ